MSKQPEWPGVPKVPFEACVAGPTGMVACPERPVRDNGNGTSGPFETLNAPNGPFETPGTLGASLPSRNDVQSAQGGRS